MAINPFLLEILVCPDTKLPVALADDNLVQQLNLRISEGNLQNVGGTLVKDKIDAALVRNDGKIAYPVRLDIPIMLVNEGIDISSISVL